MRMTIGYLIFGKSISGAEKRVIKLSLSKWFKNNNKSVLILNQSLFESATNDKELNKILLENPQKIRKIKDAYLKNDLLLLLILLRYKIKYNIDVFHSYLGARNKSLFLALVGVKVVYELTSPDVVDTFIQNYPTRRKLYSRLYRVHCVSESVHNRLIGGFQNKEYEISFKISFSSIPYTSVRLNEDICYDSKENVVLCASRFIERKNVVAFAKIAKEVLAKHPDWKIKIFGHGPQELKIKAILKNEIENKRAYVGYTNDMIEQLKKSKIVCSLIEPDNYPSQTLFEALACGNAIVVSNTGQSHIFVANSNGVLSKDLESLFNDMDRLITDENLLLKMQENSQSYYLNQFDEANYFIELINKCYI